MSDEGTAEGAPATAVENAAPEGQGTTETGGLFDSYLQAVPEDGREIVTNYLKDAEKHVNSKLQEAAELRERFGPYAEVDISRVKPDDFAQVVEWYGDVSSSPERYQEWLKQAATEAGLLEAEGSPTQGEPEGDSIEAYIAQEVAKALQPFQEQQSQKDKAAEEEVMGRKVDATLRKLESDNGVKFTDDQEEAILALGGQVEGDDWIEKGFAKYQALTGAAQADLVKDKAGQPVTPLPTGGTAAPNAPKTFAEARELAKERFAQSIAS